MKAFVLALPALLALAACDRGTPSADEGAAPADPATESHSPAPEPTAMETPAPAEIPPALRGRWGLVPGDCTSNRGDAKGLLTVSADKLEFYESVGTLDAIKESTPTRIRASFNFEGEGMTWQREIVLDVQESGAALIRRDYGDDAAPGPLRYARC